MKARINTIGLILLIVGFLLIFLGILLDSPAFYIYIALIYWVIGVIYSLTDIKHNFPFFGFNIGFFVFLLGGCFIDYLETGDFSYFLDNKVPATDEAVNHTCFCLMLTSVIINAAYITFNKKNNVVPGVKFEINPNKIVVLRKILVVFLLITYSCELYCAVSDLLFVREVSYRKSVLYLSDTSIIIVSLSSLYYIFLFIYWATLPTKGATLISILSLLFVATIDLIAGDRGGFISLVFVACYYVLFRNRVGLRDIVIKKQVVIVAVLMIPFAMYALQAISYTRNNETYEGNLIDGVSSFMYSQGGSVKIISGAYDLDEDINNLVDGKRTFVLGELKRYMKSNIFTRILMGKSKALRTVDDARSGEAFVQSYGYTLSPVTYSKGVGTGSTYIAEVYYDGGYIFLGIFNLFIVFLLIKMGTGGSNSIILNTIMFNIFRFIPLLPRGIALRWLTDTFAIQNVVVYLAVWLFLHEKSSNRSPRRYNLCDDMNGLNV